LKLSMSLLWGMQLSSYINEQEKTCSVITSISLHYVNSKDFYKNKSYINAMSMVCLDIV
jgi:hypothetical protein